MTVWLNLHPRLRLLILATLALVAAGSWLWFAPVTPKASPIAPAPVASAPTASDLLPTLTPLALQQRLQAPGIEIRQVNFTGAQAQLKVSAQWQPFIELVHAWSASSHAPTQYQLQFEPTLLAQVQLQPGRFRLTPSTSRTVESLLPARSAAKPVTTPTRAEPDCEVTPPDVKLAALWPARGYALVHMNQQLLRVEQDSPLGTTGWSVAAIAGGSLYLHHRTPPPNCQERPRFVLHSAQNR
ncbi:hypothetical protein ACR0ST_09145 [Aliidiomarina sp. Khilg15.8]